MGDMRVITSAERHLLHTAESGAMRFRVNIPLPGLGPALTFTAKQKPFLELYKIIIGRQTKLIDMTVEDQDVTVFPLSQMAVQEFQEFWISWYGKKIRMGISEENRPFLVYPIHDKQYEIGYVQFNTMSKNWAPVEWIIETSPVELKTLPSKVFEDKLRWVPKDNSRLPKGALIGGFENEPTYIARANHAHSLCPGKYVPSKGLAYVSWGGREHAKSQFEILCGYNAMWIKTQGNQIPTNAFIAGRSERQGDPLFQNDPLYIGRAMYEGKLITGKVHVRYSTCYLPYDGKEIEVGSYELLVIPEDMVPQAMPFGDPEQSALRCQLDF